MRILAVDTTTETLSLALADGPRTWRRKLKAPGRQDEVLFRETERLLRRARWKFADLDAFVAASGPGSFTGVRVGMTFVSMLAAVLGKPAVAVSLLEAEAFRAAEEVESSRNKGQSGDAGQVVCPVFAAHRDGVFFQAFERLQGWIQPLQDPRWVSLEDWPSAFRKDMSGRPVLLAVPAGRDAAKRLKRSRDLVIWQGPALTAEDLIAPAIQRLKSGAAIDFAPLYLKPAYYETGLSKRPV